MRGTVGCSQPACAIWYHAAMKQFFHGWRRKVGVAALVVACACIGMWVRSRVANDWVHVYVGPDWSLLLESGDDRILFQISFEPQQPVTRHYSIWFGSYSNNPAESGVVLDPIELEGRVLPLMTIPYWNVVAPLTLFSAYLILWAPRKRDSRPPQS